MNKIFSPLLLLLLVSCSHRQQQNNESDSLHEMSDNKSLSELSKKIDGEWYGEKYLKNIEKTKSIFASRKYHTMVFGFILDKKNLISDFPKLLGFQDHEGGYDANLKYDKEKNCFINDLSKNSEFDAFPKPFELKLVKNGHLIMYFPENKNVDNYRQVKVDFQTELRHLLFEGSYINLRDQSTIKFTKDGRISNWGEYIYYELAFDFSDGIDYDAVVFYKTMKGGNWTHGKIFKFDIDSNTLKLQLIKPDWDGFEHEITNEIFILKKE